MGGMAALAALHRKAPEPFLSPPAHRMRNGRNLARAVIISVTFVDVVDFVGVANVSVAILVVRLICDVVSGDRFIAPPLEPKSRHQLRVTPGGGHLEKVRRWRYPRQRDRKDDGTRVGGRLRKEGRLASVARVI